MVIEAMVLVEEVATEAVASIMVVVVACKAIEAVAAVGHTGALAVEAKGIKVIPTAMTTSLKVDTRAITMASCQVEAKVVEALEVEVVEAVALETMLVTAVKEWAASNH